MKHRLTFPAIALAACAPILSTDILASSDAPQIFHFDDVDVRTRVADYRIQSGPNFGQALSEKEADKASWEICQAFAQEEADFLPYYWVKSEDGAWQEADMSQKHIGDAVFHVYNSLLRNHKDTLTNQIQSDTKNQALRDKNNKAIGVLCRIQDDLLNQWSRAFCMPSSDS